MNVKFKALVAAVVLATATTSANAAIVGGGNSELVFSAWDMDAGVGYTYDLNWDKFLNDLVGADQAANPAGNLLLAAGANVKSDLIGANGVIFDGALTGLPFTGDVSGVQWNLGAFDSGVGRTRLLITQGDSALPFESNNNQVKAAATGFGGYAPASNGFITTPADDTYAVTGNTDGAAYAGTFDSALNTYLADTSNVMGGTSKMFLLAPTTLASSAAPSFAQQLLSFDGRDIVASTYFKDGEWRLQISAVTVSTPVPEPESYAMMLAGLALMGAVARRRTKKSA